ncbi:MAG TPA: glycoside hydrolase family 15 protein [Mycobacteriales bacterium]|nr:glycoside hydrolase family 15 protein [Mycobacteriales bacterium]
MDAEPPGKRPNRIADYALIGDCHTTALVGRNGAIEWLCFPRPDSPAVFCHALDDQHGGTFAVRVDGACEVSRRYIDDALVLVTTWTTSTGVLEVTDCMPVAPFDPAEPTKVTPARSVLRRIACLDGRVQAQVRVTPRFEYGFVVPRLRQPSPFVADFTGGAGSMRVIGSHELTRRDAATLRRGDVLSASWDLSAGEVAWVEATYVESHLAPDDVPAPDPSAWQQRLDDTVAFWSAWIAQSAYDGAHRDAVRRSAMVLKALIYAPTGAVVAAPTTSLPEEIGGGRNWDYRYTWVRDATLTLTSLVVLGFVAEAAAFKGWLERTGGGRPQDLQIMYGVGGERLLPEVELTHLGGHRGSRPVRTGNGAVKQLQLDSYGQLLEAAYLFRRVGGDVTDTNWEYLSGLADICCSRWRDPDQGIWEVRDEPRHFVHSKLNCWLALHRAVQLAELLGKVPSPQWAGERDAIARWLLDDALITSGDGPGWFPQAAGHPHADAATLLIPALGFLPSDDPRVLATVAAVCRDLAHDGAPALVHRYASADGLAGGEGAFLLCSFWLVDVLLHAGRVDEADDLLTTLLAHANDVGIFSEEVDPATGEHLGNTPQAFTHMAVVTSCAHLAAARRGELPLDGAPHSYAELALDRLVAARAV